MIIQESIEGKNLIKTYSDSGFMILQVGTNSLYEEAIDLETSNFIYEETNILINEEFSIEDKAEAYDILMGVGE